MSRVIMIFNIYYHIVEENSFGVGIVLEAIDHERVKHREFGFWFPIGSLPQIELRTVVLALSSIARQFRKSEVNINTRSEYLHNILAKIGNSYAIAPENNVDDVKTARRWFDLYATKLGISESPVLQKRAHERALLSLQFRQNYDSGTDG